MIDTVPELSNEDLMRDRIARIYSEQLYYLKNDPTIDVKRTAEEAIRSIISLFPNTNEENSYYWRPTQLAELAYETILERYNNPGIPGLDTGLPVLNDMLGGMEKKNIYVLNALPGSGKTTLMLQIMWHMSSYANTVVFSPEARADMLTLRLASALGHVPMHATRRGYFSEKQLSALKKGTELMKTRSLFIYDMPGLNTNEMNRILDRTEKETGKPVEAIGLDYLQQMEGDDSFSDITRNMKELETLVVKRKVACLMASQVGRASGDGSGIGSGKGSGKIEELATAVLGFKRMDEVDEFGKQTRSMIVCTKNRHEGTLFKLGVKYDTLTGFYKEEGIVEEAEKK